MIFLNIDEIVFVESNGNYSTITLTDGQNILVTKKLEEVNILLPEGDFFSLITK